LKAKFQKPKKFKEGTKKSKIGEEKKVKISLGNSTFEYE
jgi:hypothetical protein